MNQPIKVMTPHGEPVEDKTLERSSMLMVQVVGTLSVCLAGRVLPAAEVGSRKARTLLALLAVHRGPMPGNRIALVVWDDTQPRAAVANLATLVSRLRSTLGSSAIVGGRAGYRLGDETQVDLYRAADLIDEAHEVTLRDPTTAMTSAREAIRLLDNGDVLAEYPEAPWVEHARARHGQLLRRARYAVADAALRAGEIRTATEAAEAAVADDPFDETACRMLMRAQRAAGEPVRALLAYQSLRVNLARELGIDPAPATRDLHLAILRDTRSTESIGG
jgi:DNA-binding SARP family transcriptional activator